MKYLRFPLVFIVLVVASLSVAPAARAIDDLLITEFMAKNDSTLADEDGDFPDWIELFNAGQNTVNLSGWYLTDNAANLAKWRFPATNLSVNGTLIVFASSKDRRTPGRPLHTSFKLNDAGGYLALVKPDATTVQSSYTGYPLQVSDVSYGLATVQTTTTLVSNGSPAKLLVPSNGSLDTTWQYAPFNDGSWTSVTNGVGFESDAPSVGGQVLIADSVAEFSGTQGQGNWFYGYWNKKADGNGTYEAADFVPFPRGTGTTLSITNYFDGTKWDWPSPSNPPWIEMSNTGGQPSGENGNPALPVHWAIRRYISETNGPLRLTGTFACSGSSGTCGDGTIGRIFVDGVEVWSQSAFNSSLGYSIVVNASVGSVIDFAIDPGPAASDLCDATTFTVVVRTAGDSVPVADTISDWSDTGRQGQGGWTYGYFIKTNSSLTYAASRFVPFPSGSGPHSTANFWNGASWQWFDGDPPFDLLGATLCRPSIFVSGTTNGLEHWVIRRWVSEISGTILVDWHFSKKDLTGNGSTARVLLNGAQKDFLTLTASDFAGSTRTIAPFSVVAGDVLDFSVEPGADVVGDFCFLNATIHGSTTLAGQLATDVGAAMTNVSTSAYLRIPFNAVNPAAFNRLTLRMKYDDGFVAYLNGTPVAGRNTPAVTNWNSAAAASRADALASQFEEIDLTRVVGLVQPGSNVLAIHGLNSSAGDLDFLQVAELTATAAVIDATNRNYFSSPSPGAVNSSGVTALGPLITSVNHTPHDPADADDLIVTAKVTPTFYPVAVVRLYYRVQFGSETSLTMLDDGLHADGVAGDGVYGAVVPNAASGIGQMVRYYITATATNNSLTRDPPFPNASFSSQYYGAVVQNPSLTNALPVLHLFITDANLNGANNDNNARYPASLYWQGEFYDNAGINRHGQSSAGFPKKSYDIDFNSDHHFKWDPDQPRVDDINLLTTFPDKAHMRNLLSYETYRDAGSPYHFVVPVRVQTNGGFFGDWHIVENGDFNYLKRIGRDPNGALYKMYNTFTSIGNTVLGGDPNAEKKTRKHEGNSDLIALFVGVSTNNISVRTNYIYDNLNISEVVNVTAARNLTADIDCCHKNYYFYRDSDGTGEWEAMPWDVDLSFGRNWRSSCSCYWDDTMYANNYVQVGNNNSFWQAIFNTPSTRLMYYRRLRTLMDEQLQPSNTPPAQLHYEARVNELVQLIGPDGQLDLQKWGIWKTDVVGPIATNDAFYQNVRQAADVILTNYLPGRRFQLYTRAAPNSSEIPDAQPTNFVIQIGALDFNPASGNQAEEYIQLVNTNNLTLDISGWKLTGAVDHTFQGGTVMVPNSVLYVAADKKAFRSRTLAPKGGAGLYIEGPYTGQLSARGETVVLVNKSGVTNSTLAYPGNPSGPQQWLRITEIMYHPPNPPPGSTNEAEDFEYIELRNTGPTNLNLTGVHFVSGVEFTFTGSAVTSLAPGDYALVVRNINAFTNRYGPNSHIAGAYVGILDNGGENLRLDDAVGEKILDFDYDNDWYNITDGPGASLVIVNQGASWNTWGLKESWRPSAFDYGSPAASDPPTNAYAAIVVNEVLTHTDPPQKDYIELLNPTAGDVNIGGWFLSDDFATPKKFRIPNGTIITHGGYVTFDESQFNATPGVPPSFALSSHGDEVYLFSGNGTNLTGYLQGYSFEAAENGVSFGRYTNSQTNVHFVAQSALTQNGANSLPRVGPAVISEIMYRPVPLPGGVDNSLDEYIEVANIAAGPLPLFDTNHPAHTWHLRSAVDFDFPTNLTLPAGGFLVVVAFNTADAAALADFRARFSVPAQVPVVGPFSGKLDNTGESVRLYRPDAPDTNGVPYILVDQVDYANQSPWAAAADGIGPSLHRRIAGAYGNEPTNWIAVPPSPGNAYVPGGTPPFFVTQPVNTSGVKGQSAILSASATGTAPLFYQWRKDGQTLSGANLPILTLNNLALNQAGSYSVIVANTAGSIESTNAILTVRIPPSFGAQPQPVSLRGSTNNADYGNTTNNATFNVQASGNGNLIYQWRFNGNNIPGANGSTLVVTNVQLTNDGNYDVLVTDDVATISSAAVRLTVLLNPNFIQLPLAQTVPVGSVVTLSAEVSGTLPMTYDWRRGSTTLASNIVNRRTDFFSFTATNVPMSVAYRLVLKNAANPAPGNPSAFINVITVADTDGDGIPDSVETALGLDPNNAADATGDKDGDGMSNLAEYLAGTDPADPASYLRVDLTSVPGMATVQFGAITNRTYSIQYTDTMPGGTWSKLADILARGSNRVESIKDPSGTSNRFYRVVLPSQP